MVNEVSGGIRVTHKYVGMLLYESFQPHLLILLIKYTQVYAASYCTKLVQNSTLAASK